MTQTPTQAGCGGAARWLALAATPTCAAMAVWTSVVDGGPTGMLCSAAPDAWPLNGMAAMYLLMAAFHSPPWLRRLRQRADPLSADQAKKETAAR